MQRQWDNCFRNPGEAAFADNDGPGIDRDRSPRARRRKRAGFFAQRDCNRLTDGTPLASDPRSARSPRKSGVIAVPTPSPRVFDAVLQRMYHREGVDTLPTHLEKARGITVTRCLRLMWACSGSIGAPRACRSWRGCSRRRGSYAAAEADLAVLSYLAEIGFRSERPFGEQPLSSHAGQAVLVTEFVKEVPKAQRPPYPVVRLGAMIGRLHGLPVPAGADRPAGALHHFAEGTMADELRAVAGWLDSVESTVPSRGAAAFDAIRAAVVAADGGDGLPEAFVHPDPVPKNAIFTADGPVLVDWTSAGRGPRLPSMTLVLRSGWAAVPFMKGYRRNALPDRRRARAAPGTPL